MKFKDQVRMCHPTMSFCNRTPSQMQRLITERRYIRTPAYYSCEYVNCCGLLVSSMLYVPFCFKILCFKSILNQL